MNKAVGFTGTSQIGAVTANQLTNCKRLLYTLKSEGFTHFHPIETRQLMSETAIGRPSAFKGKQQTTEAKQKMKDAWIRRKESIICETF